MPASLQTSGVIRLICDMGAVEREVQVPFGLSVTTTADEVDVKPGDGICATVSNTCSLRAAVQEANALPGTQVITVRQASTSCPSRPSTSAELTRLPVGILTYSTA